jgi:hypothetical protein
MEWHKGLGSFKGNPAWEVIRLWTYLVSIAKLDLLSERNQGSREYSR